RRGADRLRFVERRINRCEFDLCAMARTTHAPTAGRAVRYRSCAAVAGRQDHTLATARLVRQSAERARAAVKALTAPAQYTATHSPGREVRSSILLQSTTNPDAGVLRRRCCLWIGAYTWGVVRKAMDQFGVPSSSSEV